MSNAQTSATETRQRSVRSRPTEHTAAAAAPGSGHAGRLGGALAALLFVGVTAFIAYRTAMRLNVAGQPHAPYWGLQDFRLAIYYPVVSLLDGNNPYDTAGYMRSYPVADRFPLYLPLTLIFGSSRVCVGNLAGPIERKQLVA